MASIHKICKHQPWKTTEKYYQPLQPSIFFNNVVSPNSFFSNYVEFTVLHIMVLI